VSLDAKANRPALHHRDFREGFGELNSNFRQYVKGQEPNQQSSAEHLQQRAQTPEAEDKINEIYCEIMQHQSNFMQQTRIDSVDVIVRRKDKRLEPIEPEPMNFAQKRVNEHEKALRRTNEQINSKIKR